MELINEAGSLTTLGGMVGALNLFEESPRLNPARVRPFVWAILLLRGAVRPSEVVASIAPHANQEDLRSWDDDMTELEGCVWQTLNKMVKDGILRVSEKSEELFVLDSSDSAVRKAISTTSTLDAQLPDHMLAEMGRSHCALYS